MIFVGLDWGREQHEVLAIDAEGAERHAGTYRHQARELSTLIADLKGLGEIRIGVERKGGPLVEVLCNAGLDVVALNPRQTEAGRRLLSNSSAKDDSRDAKVIARLLASTPDVFQPVVSAADPRLLELRSLHLQDDALMKDGVRAANRLTAALQASLPDLMKLLEMKTKWGWQVLSKVVNSTAPWRLHTKTLETASMGARKVSVAQLHSALRAAQTTATAQSWPGAARLARNTMAQMELFRQQRRGVHERIEELLANWLDDQTEETQRQAQIIESLPGVSTRLVSIFVAHLWEAVQSGGREEIRRLAGLAPITVKSGSRGKPKHAEVRLRKTCVPVLRQAFHVWGQAAVANDRYALERLRSLKARGHSHARAIRQLVDGLLRVLFAAIKGDELYSPRGA